MAARLRSDAAAAAALAVLASLSRSVPRAAAAAAAFSAAFCARTSRLCAAFFRLLSSSDIAFALRFSPLAFPAATWCC